MSASWYWTPLSPKPYIFTSPYCHFGAVSQSYLWCCLPGCSPHFAPDKTTWNLYIFLSWHQDPLSYTISSSLLKSMSTELVMLSNHLILCHSLLLLSIFPSIRVFSMSCLFTLGSQSIGASASATKHSHIKFQLFIFHLNLRLNASLACFGNITVNVSKREVSIKNLHMTSFPSQSMALSLNQHLTSKT